MTRQSAADELREGLGMRPNKTGAEPAEEGPREVLTHKGGNKRNPVIGTYERIDGSQRPQRPEPSEEK